MLVEEQNADQCRGQRLGEAEGPGGGRLHPDEPCGEQPVRGGGGGQAEPGDQGEGGAVVQGVLSVIIQGSRGSEPSSSESAESVGRSAVWSVEASFLAKTV